MRRALRACAMVAGACCLTLSPRVARASSALEFPDNGSEQEGRGGAWVARASDPLAAFYNPAGLAGQPTRLTLQGNISSQNTCFTRVKAAGDQTQNDGATSGGTYPQVCNNGGAFIDPQLAFTYRLSDRIGIGVAVLGPSAVGNQTWPEFINGSTPSPQRYLLMSSTVVLLTPTIGVGWEVTDGLRLGAAFIAGTAPLIDFVTASPPLNLLNTNPTDASGARTGDLRGELKAKDLFIPGFTAGAIWSATRSIDVAGWYKYMSPIDAKGDILTGAGYFTPAVAQGNTSGVYYGSSTLPNCNIPARTDNPCGGGNIASVKVPLPMEAKLGFRYHALRSEAEAADPHLRDPIAQDIFDVEADLTWANDSAFDALQLRFPGTAGGQGTVPVAGTPGTLPPNADVRHHFRDVYGVRVGGDYNVVPDQLAVRAGGFFETQAADPTYQNIDFDAAQRVGVALGGTYRLRLGAEKKQSLDLMLAYGHVFFGTLTNKSPSAQGLTALAGEPCLQPASPTNGQCPGGQQIYRTAYPVNLGTITSSINVLNVGASLTF